MVKERAEKASFCNDRSQSISLSGKKKKKRPKVYLKLKVLGTENCGTA